LNVLKFFGLFFEKRGGFMEKNTGLYLTAVVGVVAIVALAMMVMNNGDGQLASFDVEGLTLSEDLAGQGYAKIPNMAEQRFTLKQQAQFSKELMRFKKDFGKNNQKLTRRQEVSVNNILGFLREQNVVMDIDVQQFGSFANLLNNVDLGSNNPIDDLIDVFSIGCGDCEIITNSQGIEMWVCSAPCISL
jgi:hypothetical protein